MCPGTVCRAREVPAAQVRCKVLGVYFLTLRFRSKEVGKAIKRGVDYIKSIQREDGSWLGSW